MDPVLVVANGELDGTLAPRLRGAAFSRIIAVDGGAAHCLRLGLRPELVVGDLDSLQPGLQASLAEAGSAFERHPAEKDETDLELALLRAVSLGADRIILAGALGGRLDMSLANLLLPALPEFEGIRIELWEPRSTAWLLRPPGEEVEGAPGDTLSLVPLAGNAEGLVTEGLAYPLRDETLVFGRTRGLSNVFTGVRARVGLRAGKLLAVHVSGRA
jgi:thiamine pyrophosphokinase